MNGENHTAIKNFICAALVCLFALLITLLMVYNGAFPHGSHIYGHLFKADLLYRQIISGNPYPIYNKNWYSGMEIFRYWPPAAYYFYAIIMMFNGGQPVSSYIVFTFLIHAISGCGFLLFIKRSEKRVMCTLLGIAYMCLPENMRLFFAEGNIPIIFATALLPWFVFFACEFVIYKSRGAIIGVDLVTMLLACSHIMTAAMVLIATAFFFLVYSLVSKKFKNSLMLLLNMALSHVTMGIFLVPYFSGGLLGHNQKASQYTFETVWGRSAAESLNPFRFPYSSMDFYFGISVFIIMVLGLLVWRKDTLPYFLTAVMIFIGTTLLLVPVITAMPFSQMFWMIRYVPLAYVLVFAGIIFWKEIKRKALIIFGVLLGLDCLLALSVHLRPDNPLFPSEEEIAEDYMLDKAMKYTENRMACMDLTSIGSYISYVLIKNGNDVDSLFGWDYPGAYTINEIVELNEAFETGYYDYVLDRLIRYGCDTLVVKKDEVKNDYRGFLTKAEEFGYRIADETQKGILLDFRSHGKFCTVFNYPNACIGMGSEYMSYLYPSFFKLRSSVLDDYSFDDLKKYKKIYITGPEYRDKEHCEDMLMKLSDAGVEIYIDMNRLPVDLSTGRNSILGVVAQPIVFNDEFPILSMDNGSEFKLVLDKAKFTEWRTVYFTNLKNVTKTARYSTSKHLPYLGTSPNKNITFIGLNLVYFQGCGVNQDSQLYRFLDEVFDVDRSYLPARELVELKVDYRDNDIILDCPRDNVMTTLANLDSFESSGDTGDQTLIMADEGTLTLHVQYAYLLQGSVCSLVGLVLTMILIWYIMKYYNITGITVRTVMRDHYREERERSEQEKAQRQAEELKKKADAADIVPEEKISYLSEGYRHSHFKDAQEDNEATAPGTGQQPDVADGQQPDSDGSGGAASDDPDGYAYSGGTPDDGDDFDHAISDDCDYDI